MMQQQRSAEQEVPGKLLQKAVHTYVRAVRAAPDSLPSLPVATLRELIASDLGGRASMYTRRMVVVAEWLTRLNIALTVAFDDETAAQIMRHARKELDEQLPIIS